MRMSTTEITNKTKKEHAMQQEILIPWHSLPIISIISSLAPIIFRSQHFIFQRYHGNMTFDPFLYAPVFYLIEWDDTDVQTPLYPLQALDEAVASPSLPRWQGWIWNSLWKPSVSWWHIIVNTSLLIIRPLNLSMSLLVTTSKNSYHGQAAFDT